MITFRLVVRVLLGVVKSVRDDFLDHSFEGLGEIGDDLVWVTMGDQRLGEECSGGCDIPSRCHEDVDDLAVLIYASVDVSPFPGDLHIGFVNEPATANAASSWAGGVDQ